MAEEEVAEGEEGKKSNLKMIIIIVVIVIVVAGGSVAGTLMLLGDSSSDEAEVESSEPQEEAKKDAVYQKLAPAFIVNFQIGSRQRLMKVDLTAMMRDRAYIDALVEHMPRIRNDLVMVMAGSDFDELRTDAGKRKMQQALLDKVNEILEVEGSDASIERILYTNIVMQ